MERKFIFWNQGKRADRESLLEEEEVKDKEEFI
jgi:hypothetical protein